jgi:TonB family protein
MKKTTRRIFTTTCALALAANSFTAFAQDKQQPKQPAQTIERQAVFTTTDGQTFDVKVGEPGRGGIITGATGGAMTFMAAGQDGASYSFMASEVGSTNKVVKGAPYSAEVISEFVQTLADGNRIVRRNNAKVARDSQGRMLREQIAQIGLSGLAAGQEPLKMTMLTDPVEGVTYVLNEKTRTAQRMTMRDGGGTFTFMSGSGGGVGGSSSAVAVATASPDAPKRINVSGGVLQGSALKRVQPAYPVEAKAAKVSGIVQVQVTINENGDVIGAEAISGHPLLRDAALTAARQWKFKPTELGGQPVKVQGTLTFNFTLADDSNPDNRITVAEKEKKRVPAEGLRMNFTSDSLGKQMIEGVECEGTRRVSTIPAGQMGNERPIEIVFESWYSPELQVTMLSKQSDPRYGETTIRVANLLRVEPDEFLFKVPSDYTIKEANQTSIRTTKPE